MKIGIDGRCLNNPHITGIERMLIRILENWPADGPECIVYVEQSIRQVFPNCTVKIMTPRQIPPVWFQISLPLALLRDKIDTFVAPVTIFPLWLPRRLKTVTIVYDLAYIRFPHFYSTHELHLLNGRVAQSIHRSSLVITDSHNTTKDVIQLLGVSSKKVATVHLAADPVTPPSPIPEKYGVKKPYLLTIGTAYGRKNLAILIPVLKILKERYHSQPYVVMVGKKGFAEEKIIEAAAHEGVGDQILHLGYVTDDETHSLLANASAFFFPSLYEGFGIPVLEAMQYGCPVVCANTSSLPEVAGDAALMFDPKDPAAAAEAIHRILTDETTVDRLVSRAQKNVTRFSWKKTTKNFIDAILSTQKSR